MLGFFFSLPPHEEKIAGDHGEREGAARPRSVRRHRTDTVRSVQAGLWARGVAATRQHLNVYCARFTPLRLKNYAWSRNAGYKKGHESVLRSRDFWQCSNSVRDVGERLGPNHLNECADSGGQTGSRWSGAKLYFFLNHKAVI